MLRARSENLHAGSQSGLQTKLKIAEAGDRYEQEADRIADQVIAMPAPGTVAEAPRQIQRFSGPSPGQTDTAPASVEKTLSGPGNPLEPALQQDMEQRFGYDFSPVRIYSGTDAGQSAQDVNAHAYTVGNRIAFGAGRFAPATPEGRRLLAHELTHVVQQSGVSRSGEVLARQPSDPNIERARKLAKKLQEKKRDDVINDIVAMKATDLDALEVAATQAFALDKPQADDLRRIIRFARHKPGKAKLDKDKPTAEIVKVNDAGTLETKAGAKVPGGKVELHTGVSMKYAGDSSTEAYSLTYTGANVDDMRWLQFIWRELVPEFPPKAKGDKPRKEPVAKELSHSGRDYRLTTDPTRPSWNTDSGSSATPFYEDNTSAIRTADELTMFDSPKPMEDVAAAFFKATVTNKPTRVISHFHATTYLIHRMDVLYRADVDLTWEFTSEAIPPVKVQTKGKLANNIEPVHHERLASQDPNVDYLPGAARDPLGEFDVVQDLFPKGSLTEQQWADSATTDLQRYKDIVSIAHAGWINDVSGSKDINIATDLQTGVKPGLNYYASLDKPGKTGYIDAKGVYHNPDFPVDPKDPLPRIAIILGPDAFKRDKGWGLETLRHELRHAAHEQLAIGWLLKWQEDGAKKTFKEWLRAKHKKKDIKDPDFDLVATGIQLTGTDVDLAATEVLAYAEGIITALPLLPPKPDLQLIAGDKYPAAIRGLKEARPFFDSGGSKAATDAAFDRIHDFSCEALVESQRDAFVAWIDFLLDPKSLKATSEADKDTITLVTSDFKSHKSFLKKVRGEVKKACK
jgi:hypothetical protein